MSRFITHAKHNTVGYLALFVALGGTSYAAVQLPRNSVGAAQIQSSAVGTSEVRDRSIKTADLAPATRSALKGNPGPAGEKGPAGAPGATGAAGPAGTGTSDVVIIKEDLEIPVGGSIRAGGAGAFLDAGKWALQAAVTISNSEANPAYVACQLYSPVAGTLDGPSAVTLPPVADAPAPAGGDRLGSIALAGSADFAFSSLVMVSCDRTGAGTGAATGRVTITATRASTITPKS
ncbi:MAG: hypothetical protein V9E83_03940 [Baekduia sp.]